MSVLNENTIIGASAAGEYEIEQSLRFDNGRGTYLLRTPSVAGNRKTWTWSGWVKRGTLGSAYRMLFGADYGVGGGAALFFYNDNLYFSQFESTFRVSTAAYRDPSAWYHVVFALDTTQATANNRVKMYVNGIEITAFNTLTNPTQNADLAFNGTVNHAIGADIPNTGARNWFDGYLGEVNFIDGQALTPDSFGETGDYGEWKPKAYAGTYGTNGFYLPFEQDYAVEGFSTVTYEGNAISGHYIGGVGFSPSLTWFKRRSGADNHTMYDVVRGATKSLSSNLTGAEVTRANSLTGFSTDGFVLGNDGITNADNQTFVAWNWDMGDTTASNTSGSITSSVRANTTYGQSVVSFTTGAGADETVGHGLASAPEVIICKRRDGVSGWFVRWTGFSATEELSLNTTGAKVTDNNFNGVPNSSVFTINRNTNQMVAYCFHSVAGYSKFSSYTGNGSTTGPVVTLGFSPAFVMIKRTDSSGDDWHILDNTRNPFGQMDNYLYPNNSSAEYNGANDGILSSSTGFQLKNAYNGMNASGATYIYAAFADTREYAYWLDQSGNNNDWTSEGGLTESDVMVDSPTNNFATLNPLTGTAIAFSEGNLKATKAAGSPYPTALSTIAMHSGKFYFEAVSLTGNSSFGIMDTNATGATYWHDSASTGYGGGYYYDGSFRSFGIGSVSYASTFTNGDVIGAALDLDAGTLTFYKNNVSQGVAVSGLTATSTKGFFFGMSAENQNTVANFGQDSSFAGNKTPQGNSDSNGIGDFYYAPPTGFLALCTANLPDVDVIPSEHFNPVIYTGNGSTQSITGVGFQPDFVWNKKRAGGTARNHMLTDSVRGVLKCLSSSLNDAEFTNSNGLSSFDSDGFSVGSYNNFNESGGTYVSWNWKAGGTAVSNTNGSITSSVSANPSAGFSIVSWTSDGSNGLAVGHGLASAPQLIIYKPRNAVNEWYTWLNALVDSSQDYVRLNSTAAKVDINSAVSGVPSSTLISNFGFANTNTMIAYCFHSVESYSKVGSYTGNGSDDGPFVHCGLRPAFILTKRTDGTSPWRLFDNKRPDANFQTYKLEADSSGAELTGYSYADFLSNGFKIRDNGSYINANGGNYIFIAFAESPFKHTNAR